MSYLDDSVFNTVEKLRDSETLVAMLRRVWHDMPDDSQPVESKLLYLNYKPFERARLVVSLTVVVGDNLQLPDPVWLSFEVRADAHADKSVKAAMNQGEPSAFVIPGWNTQGWILPQAPNLSELETLLDPELLRERVMPKPGMPPAPLDIQLLRYIPRKRAVLLISSPGQDKQIYAKLMRSKDSDDVASCFSLIDQAARKGVFDFGVPSVLHHDRALGTIFMSEVAGRPFTEFMRKSDDAITFTALGKALASLHRADIQTPGRWTIENQLNDLQRHLAGMGRALPVLNGRLNALIRTLSGLGADISDDTSLPIHGNLFGDQILWDGQRIGIVDWDMLALGDPLYDLGRLLAHQLYVSCLNGIPPQNTLRCTEAFILAYDRANERETDRWRLAWHVAVELLLRAKISSLRPLSPNSWPKDCARIVSECERLLNGHSEYMALPPLLHRMKVRA